MPEEVDDPLTYEEIGRLLQGSAEKLIEGNVDPEMAIHDALKTLARSESVLLRETELYNNGRITIRSDLGGVRGAVLFHPTPGEHTNPRQLVRKDD